MHAGKIIRDLVRSNTLRLSESGGHLTLLALSLKLRGILDNAVADSVGDSACSSLRVDLHRGGSRCGGLRHHCSTACANSGLHVCQGTSGFVSLFH